MVCLGVAWLSLRCKRLISAVCTTQVCWVVSRFLLTWTSFLPFALYSRFQWLTPFVAAIITFLLFGVCSTCSLAICLIAFGNLWHQ